MKKTALYGIALLVLIILIGGGYYGYTYYSAHKQQQMTMLYNQQAEGARTSFNSGDYTTAINELPTAIAGAPNKTEAGRLELILAGSYMSRNQDNDLAQAMVILKKVVNDYSMAPWIRSLALNSIAVNVYNNGLAFYTLYLTNDAPFNTYLPASGTDTQRAQTAYLKILQLSDETFPNSFAEYSIAGNYYAPLLSGGGIAATQENDTATLMQKYVAEGDALKDTSLYASSNVVFMQLYRALALSASYRVLKTPTTDVIEQAFKLPITTGDTSSVASSNLTLAGGVLRSRFFYAAFLMRNFNGARNADIVTLLQPFAQASVDNNALGLLTSLNTLPDTNYVKSQALQLAQISPGFKAFLTKTGVSFK